MRRIRLALAALGLVIVGGTVGYLLLGFSLLEALYQTVTTITTVGYREVRPLGSGGEVFTIVLILVGVGTALYTFGVLLEALIEGHLRTVMEERRMAREIASLRGHVVICGWGRVGRAAADYLRSTGQHFVIVDRDPERLAGVTDPFVQGDVTDDATLRAAGVMRAGALIAALDTDADNVFVTLSSRALRPDLVIIARARNEASRSKLFRAGADRAVNPQLLGGHRMATFALQPQVADFLEVVLHDESLDYRMEQITIAKDSTLDGLTVGEADLTHRCGALMLAVHADGAFLTNPPQTTPLRAGSALIVVGTSSQLAAARDLAH